MGTPDFETKDWDYVRAITRNAAKRDFTNVFLGEKSLQQRIAEKIESLGPLRSTVEDVQKVVGILRSGQFSFDDDSILPKDMQGKGYNKASVRLIEVTPNEPGLQGAILFQPHPFSSEKRGLPAWREYSEENGTLVLNIYMMKAFVETIKASDDVLEISTAVKYEIDKGALGRSHLAAVTEFVGSETDEISKLDAYTVKHPLGQSEKKYLGWLKDLEANTESKIEDIRSSSNPETVKQRAIEMAEAVSRIARKSRQELESSLKSDAESGKEATSTTEELIEALGSRDGAIRLLTMSRLAERVVNFGPQSETVAILFAMMNAQRVEPNVRVQASMLRILAQVVLAGVAIDGDVVASIRCRIGTR